MDQRLMIAFETEMAGNKIVFSVQINTPFKLILEAIHEFQGSILERQRLAELQQSEIESQKQSDLASENKPI